MGVALVSSLTVLLPTYNGARYLPGQLDSLRRQNDSDFRVMIQDDGSSDATVDLNICPVALAEHEFRIFVVSFGGVWNLGDSLLVTALLPTVENSE